MPAIFLLAWWPQKVEKEPKSVQNSLKTGVFRPKWPKMGLFSLFLVHFSAFSLRIRELVGLLFWPRIPCFGQKECILVKYGNNAITSKVAICSNNATISDTTNRCVTTKINTICANIVIPLFSLRIAKSCIMPGGRP